MSEVGGIYDNGPISPIARIKDNLTIWTSQKWQSYRIDFIEPLPRSSQMIVEMVTATGGTTIAANGTIGKAVVVILQLAENEFMHLRWEPLDDMEGVLWEQSSVGRFHARSVQSRVTLGTWLRDPYLTTTTFWILGQNRDMNLEVRNPNPVPMPSARFIFWGFRYILEPVPGTPAHTIYLPAEGRQ